MPDDVPGGIRVASLHVYPVKSCHRVDVDEAVVEPWGLAGDRRWLLVDDSGKMVSQRELRALALVRPTLTDDGLRLAAPNVPDLDVRAVHADPGDVSGVSVWGTVFPASPAGPAADRWLSEAAGRPLRLMWMHDPTSRPVEPGWSRAGDVVSAADGYPLLLASTASLAQLNDWILEGGTGEGPVPMTRFRPSVVVDGAPAWAEDDWTGRRLRIGDVVMRVANPCARCVMTTTDQETGERHREPLRTLARYRKVGQELRFATNMIPDGPGRIRVGDPVEVVD